MKTYIEVGLAMFAVVVLTTLFTVTVMVMQGQQFSGMPVAQPRLDHVVKPRIERNIELPKDRYDPSSIWENRNDTTGAESNNDASTTIMNDLDIINTNDVNIKK